MEVIHKIFCSLVFVALIGSSEVALAVQHVVGGTQGWDESADFSSWVSGQKFKAGDQLVFKYTAGLHSVVELGSESAYKNCDISSAVDSLNGGNNVVKLNKAGTRYFACGTSGHCGQGMKVKITTVSATAIDSSSSSPSTTPTSSSSSSSSPPSTTTSAVLMVSSLVPIIFISFLN